MKFSISKLVVAVVVVICVAAFVLASIAAVSAEEVLGQGGLSSGVESPLARFSSPEASTEDVRSRQNWG